ncbi:hypothetical protein BOTU111922_26560 [Bordetella tumulicola]
MQLHGGLAAKRLNRIAVDAIAAVGDNLAAGLDVERARRSGGIHLDQCRHIGGSIGRSRLRARFIVDGLPDNGPSYGNAGGARIGARGLGKHPDTIFADGADGTVNRDCHIATLAAVRARLPLRRRTGEHTSLIGDQPAAARDALREDADSPRAADRNTAGAVYHHVDISACAGRRRRLASAVAGTGIKHRQVGRVTHNANDATASANRLRGNPKGAHAGSGNGTVVGQVDVDISPIAAANGRRPAQQRLQVAGSLRRRNHATAAADALRQNAERVIAGR